MPGPICKSFLSSAGAHDECGLLRVLLDDVLAAVDAHVARHLFGQRLGLSKHFSESNFTFSRPSYRPQWPPLFESTNRLDKQRQLLESV